MPRVLLPAACALLVAGCFRFGAPPVPEPEPVRDVAAYCTPSHIFQLARRGGSLQPVCPPEQRPGLYDAFLDGREIHAGWLKLRESDQRLADIEQFSRVGAISARDRERTTVEPRAEIRQNRADWEALRARDNKLSQRYDAPPMPYASRHY